MFGVMINSLTPEKDNSELNALIDKLKTVRGSAERWLEKTTVLNQYLSNTEKHQRVLCLGECRKIEFHTPAVLIYDEHAERPEVWTPIGSDDRMVSFDISCFWSTTPHAWIAKEVYGKHSKNDTI